MTMIQWNPIPTPDFILNAFYKHKFEKNATETSSNSDQIQVEIIELSEFHEISATMDKICMLKQFRQDKYEVKETSAPYIEKSKVSDLQGKIKKKFSNENVILINHVCRKILLPKILYVSDFDNLAKQNNYELSTFENKDKQENIDKLIVPLLWQHQGSKIDNKIVDSYKQPPESTRWCTLF